jgi:hypothetical protein
VGGHGGQKILTRCRIGPPPFVEEVEGVRWGHPGKGGDMTEYLIAFNDEWVPDHTSRRRGCGPERSRWPAAGRRRCDASRSPCNFRRLLNEAALLIIAAEGAVLIARAQRSTEPLLLVAEQFTNSQA